MLIIPITQEVWARICEQNAAQAAFCSNNEKLKN